MTQIRFPFGEAETPVMSATGIQEENISDAMIIFDGWSFPASGNRTLNLTIDVAGTVRGSQMFVVTKTLGTETTIFGTGMAGQTLTGVAGKTFVTSFIYETGIFIQSAPSVQVD